MNTLKRIAQSLSLVFFIMLAGVFLQSCSDNGQKQMTSFTIAKDPTWYPLKFENEYVINAFAEDLFNAIAAEQKISISLVDIGPSEIYLGLNNGTWDGILTSWRELLDSSYLNEDNQLRYALAKPFYSDSIVLLVNNDSPIRSFEDIKGKPVAVPRDITLPQAIIDQAGYFITFPTVEQGIEQIKNHNQDVLVLDLIHAQYFMEIWGDQFRLVNTPVAENTLRLVALSTDKGIQLINQVNAGMHKLMASGVYSQLQAKWQINSK